MRLSLPVLANCGHETCRPLAVIMGYTMCPECSNYDMIHYTLRVADRVTLYLGEGDRTVVTWHGAYAGRVVRNTTSRQVSRNYRRYVRVRDTWGRSWHGTGPVDDGIYVSLRASKGDWT